MLPLLLLLRPERVELLILAQAIQIGVLLEQGVARKAIIGRRF